MANLLGVRAFRPEAEVESLESDSEETGKSKSTRASRDTLASGKATSSLSIPLTDPDDTFNPNEKLGFDIKFFSRFWVILKILFHSTLSLSSWLFLTLVVVSLLEEYVVYQVGLIPSKFYRVLGDKDLPGFWKVVTTACGIITGMAMVKSGRQYLMKLLTVTWRQILCKHLHRCYFSDLIYYRLNVLDKKIDNPDQRITQDVDKFSTTFCDILPRTIVTPVVICYYAYQGFVGTGWQGPVGCFVFFLIGTVINKVIMSPIVNLVAQQERFEGDFRFVHMQVKINAEAIAFHDASMVEGDKADDALITLAKAQHRLYFWQLFLNSAVNLFDYIGSIVSYLIIAVPIFAGVYDDKDPSEISSIISKNSFVSMYLIYKFSQLVDLSISVTDLAGVTHRISQLIERMLYLRSFWKNQFKLDVQKPDPENMQKFHDLTVNGRIAGDDAEPWNTEGAVPGWILDGVTFTAPFRQSPLVRDLKMTIYSGQSVLINGGSSAGKSSLLRVLRGLWPYSDGSINRLIPPGPSGVFFIPQKLYLTAGSLREQFAFPCQPHAKFVDAFGQKIIHYMRLLNLQHLLERVGSLDVPVQWNIYESLSPGEIQRIYFIRLFLHSPLFAVLDEATSALPVDMEEIVYKECHRLGITLVSVGHRDSLRKYHHVQLTLQGAGSWNFENLSE